MNTQLPEYKKPDLLSEEVIVPKSNVHKVINQLKLIRKWIDNLLIRKSEFTIWQGKDRAGNELWKVYDAKNSRTISLESEAEVRVWIEESFYRQNVETKPINAFDLYQQRLFC